MLLVRDGKDGEKEIAYDRGVICSALPIPYNTRVDNVEVHSGSKCLALQVSLNPRESNVLTTQFCLI